LEKKKKKGGRYCPGKRLEPGEKKRKKGKTKGSGAGRARSKKRGKGGGPSDSRSGMKRGALGSKELFLRGGGRKGRRK